MTDEEFVRKNWNGARYDGHRVLSDHSIKGATWILSGNSNCKFEYSNHLDESVAWARAAEFTRDRLEHIRQVKEEIDHLSKDIANCQEHDWIADEAIYERILASEQAVLSELKKGMK